MALTPRLWVWKLRPKVGGPEPGVGGGARAVGRLGPGPRPEEPDNYKGHLRPAPTAPAPQTPWAQEGQGGAGPGGEGAGTGRGTEVTQAGARRPGLCSRTPGLIKGPAPEAGARPAAVPAHRPHLWRGRAGG